jgi:hypothetical protein
MKAITIQAAIAPDGKLLLELPTGLPPGPAEVVVVVHPTPAGPAACGPSVVGKHAEFAQPDFDAVAEVREVRRRAVREAIDKAHLQGASAGSEAGTPTEEPIPESEPQPPNKFCSELFLGRLPEDYDIDAALDEMNAQWKTKLEDLRLEP